MAYNRRCWLILSAALVVLSGCSSVSQRAEERRPFFQTEYDLTSHGRKTLFDRVVANDSGGLHVTVASDYQIMLRSDLRFFRSPIAAVPTSLSTRFR